MLLDKLSVPMPGDKFIVRQPERPWIQELGTTPQRLRVAICLDSWSSHSVDAEVVASVKSAAIALEHGGHYVEHARPTLDWDEFVETETVVISTSAVDAVDVLAAASGLRPSQETLERTVLALDTYGRGVSAAQLGQAMRAVNGFSRRLGRFFEDWDLLVTPTINVPPLPLGYHDANDARHGAHDWIRHIFDTCSFTAPFNWSGSPAMSLPLGWSSEGLPIGVQIVAPMCDEATLFRVAGQLEAALPWSDRKPAIHASTD